MFATGERTAKLACLIATAGWIAAAPIVAIAQDHYPSRPIRIITPGGPSAVADMLPRIVGERLAAKWGQPVVVESRPGAANNIAAEAVARAEPDGYTLFCAPPPALAINQSLYGKLPFDPGAFVPVTVIAAVPNVLVVHPNVPVSSLQELVAVAKASPDKLNYASAGSGSTLHLSAELLMAVAGIRMVHVPYKSADPALIDVLAGRVDMMFIPLGNALPHIKGGKLRALGVGSEKRVAAISDVPTISETLPGFLSVAWFAIVAPPKTSPAIAAKLSDAISATLRVPEVVSRLRELAAIPIGGSPAETAAFIKDETERWRKVIVAAGVKVE